jgi:branched-chain amino acid transport system permease protein
MLTVMAIYVILTATLDIQYGQTGLISLAHAVFFGIGAYSCGILQVRLGIPFWPALCLAVGITALFSALIGLPLLRTKGPYFALGSLALAAIMNIIIFNWASLTGGYSLTNIPGPAPIRLFGAVIDFSSRSVYYILVLIFAFLIVFCVRRVVHSRVGRALLAIREDEDLAESLGVNLMGYKILAFSFSSALAAVAGGLYAGYMGAIEPAIAGYHMGFEILVMNIVGGPSTIAGYIAGPFIIWIFPEFLGAAEAYRPLIFGSILVLAIIYMPLGVAGSLRKIHPVLAKWIQ